MSQALPRQSGLHCQTHKFGLCEILDLQAALDARTASFLPMLQAKVCSIVADSCLESHHIISDATRLEYEPNPNTAGVAILERRGIGRQSKFSMYFNDEIEKEPRYADGHQQLVQST